jgi:methylmalonyl-CoA/ethylmalonyl-CoA epimerase
VIDMVIDHIGIAVKSLEEGIAHWKTVFGYEQLTKIIVNTRQKVRVVFLSKKDSLQVKLIEPIDTTSPVYAFAQRGGGLHHLCFRCAKLGEEISRLSALGLRVLVEPQPGEAFENEDIAFLFAKQGLNIELVDTDKRAGMIGYAGERDGQGFSLTAAGKE